MSDTTDLDVLTREFPAEAIKQRVIGGGRKADYLEGHTVINRLNAATGNHWDFTVDRYWSEEGKVLAMVTLTLPGCGSRQHIGVQATDNRSGEDATAKGAITDALKKAATLFGVGLSLYGPEYAEEAGPPAAARPTAEPLTEAQEKTLADALDMAESGETYNAVAAVIRAMEADATPGQWRVIKHRFYALRERHYPATIPTKEGAR